jgi:hypothetical protein
VHHNQIKTRIQCAREKILRAANNKFLRATDCVAAIAPSLDSMDCAARRERREALRGASNRIQCVARRIERD